MTGYDGIDRNSCLSVFHKRNVVKMFFGKLAEQKDAMESSFNKFWSLSVEQLYVTVFELMIVILLLLTFYILNINFQKKKVVNISSMISFINCFVHAF